MKRRIVLHLGLSKTGTTSIQRFLSDNRRALAAHSVLYPDVSGLGPLDVRLGPSVLKPSSGREPSHIALALELRRSRGARPDPTIETPLWSAAFRQIEESGADTTIISYENFYLRPELYSFDLISNHLKLFDVHGIIYLRPIEDWIVSLYGQTVKGIKRSDSDFSRYAASPPALLPYSSMIDAVLENIPLTSLSIGDFYLAAKQGLTRDFLDKSGVVTDEITADQSDGASNISLPGWATLFLLRCNRGRLSDEAFVDVRKTLSRSAQQRRGPALRPGLDVATPDERQKLRDIEAADAQRLWDRHSVRLSGKIREPIAYRAFDDEDFELIREAIDALLPSTTRLALEGV